MPSGGSFIRPKRWTFYVFMENRIQCYKLNVLCNEVYANGSTGTEQKKKKCIRLAHKLIAFICDFPQGKHNNNNSNSGLFFHD